jgi:glycosyltransferase involved in cell wall biosynthesis
MSEIRLGFACVWDAEPRRTWSYTPWELRAALRQRAEVVDLGIQLSLPARRALQVAGLKRRGGRWVTRFEHLRSWEWASESLLARRAASRRCDAVLEIQDLGALPVPYFLYQDLSYDIALTLLDENPAALGYFFPHLERDVILRRRDRQHRIYQQAAGVFAMSGFLARSLVKDTGLDAGKVHTIHPGAAPDATVPGAALAPRPGPRRRLLFVGTNFRVKAGEVVVAALEVLRREHDPRITLTVVGPSTWPLPGDVPPGIDFRGRVAAGEVEALYDSHDLLVVPSRLEGFGKVFVEALARGLPCIGRNAFAMPELIRPGQNGDLVEGDDPSALAGCIIGVLADDGIYARCAASRDDVLRTFNWDRAASDMIKVISEEIGKS